MQVILLDKIGKLGDLGDTVNVKAGYGRNFLLPAGKAMLATKENLAIIEEQKAELVKKMEESKSKAIKRGELLTELVLSISAKVGEEGKLFGSVGTQDISDAIKQQSIEVEKKEILLADGPLRTVGTHKVAIRLHPDVTIELEVLIVDDTKES
ncbi:MAG: 50S ribosomal protein L9 [Methylococcaceae bacterium TMED69]|nr:MAG: 50S ribosomal protein L9 [Methylococcaceae bacterium TMED69]|tara:strand:+ start:188 stop:646 length:459 start_codon:yes stop_codon:yes gene_type:complete